jgi:hypothetical protein
LVSYKDISNVIELLSLEDASMSMFGSILKVAQLLLITVLVGSTLATCSAPEDVLLQSTSHIPAQPKPQTTAPFATGLKTSDGKVLIQFSITPNRFGSNQFLVDLRDASTGNPATNKQVQIFTTMLDMDMATGVIILQSHGNGHYSAQGDLPMDGNWDIHIQLLDTAIHVAKVKVYIPA